MNRSFARLGLLTLLAATFGSNIASGHARNSSTDEFQIPFYYDPLVAPGLVVQMRVGDSKPMPVIVDTGVTGGILIEHWAARDLQLRPTGKHLQLTPHNVQLDEYATEPWILTGIDGPNSMRLDFQFAGAGDLKPLQVGFGGRRVAGAIGNPLLDFCAMKVDFDNQMIRLSMDRPAKPPIGTSIVPLQVRNSEGRREYFVTARIGNENNLPFLIDTGASTTVVPTRLRGVIQPKATRPAHTELYRGRVEGVTMLVDDFSLGNVRVNDAELFAIGDVGLLGLDILSRFNFTIDSKGGQLILENRKTGSYKPRGDSGIQLMARGEILTTPKVISVAEASPADQAGIRPGDELLLVDGHNAALLPGHCVQRLVDGFANTQASLVVRRAGRRMSLTFKRGSVFASVRKAN